MIETYVISFQSKKNHFNIIKIEITKSSQFSLKKNYAENESNGLSINWKTKGKSIGNEKNYFYDFVIHLIIN